MKNIGFIGVGYMGYGIAKNILKFGHKLYVVANKNRKPIDKIVSDGAEEIKSLEEFSNKKSLTGEEQAERREILRVKSKTELEYWTRINTPFQVIVFILIGFTMGIKKGRGRTKNTGMISFGILIAYYVVFFAGVSLAQKGKIHTWLVVFIPTLLATLISGFFYRKLDWEN